MPDHQRVWRRQDTIVFVTIAVAAAVTFSLRAQSNIQTAVNAAHSRYQNLHEGKNADYIPALAKVDPNLFGIAVVTADGHTYTAGDVRTEVSIQSISKVFTMARVIQDEGPEAIEKRSGPELNPLVNTATTATSMVQGNTADAVWAKIIGTYNDFAGRQLSVLQDVYKSESDTDQRKQATDLYTRQCAVGVNTKDLATMAATLAFGGRNPITGRQAINTEYVPYVLAVMATAGLYDDSGKWLYQTGLPAKSGVGGGIIAVSPGNFGIAVVSPPLDDAGNSIRAQKAIRDISAALNGNPYAAAGRRQTAD
jgi:glutaminase